MLNLPVRLWISTAITIESIYAFIVNIDKCCSASHILGYSSLVVPSSETKSKDSECTPAAASFKFKKFRNSNKEMTLPHSMRTQKLPMILGNHVIFRIGQVAQHQKSSLHLCKASIKLSKICNLGNFTQTLHFLKLTFTPTLC